MLSIREIARNLGCSRQYIQRKVKEGCPRDTLENVTLWFQVNTQKSRITQCRLEKIIADEKGAASRGQGACRRESSTGKPERQIEEEEDTNSPEACIFIPLIAARNMAWRGFDEILDLVDQLPKNVAAQCNAADLQLVLTVLESECSWILCKAFDVYAVWSKGGPHISTAANTE
jgi:hypothetical protein